MTLVLVSGGTRSGKSEFAEALVAGGLAPVLYLATGTAGDAEMAERIGAHRDRRPADWDTVESPDPLPALRDAGDRAVLVDSLGGWIGHLLDIDGLDPAAPVAPLGAAGEERRRAALADVEAFARVAAERPALTVMVAEECGQGLVAADAFSRRWLDLLGAATQVLSRAAAEAFLLVGGRPLRLGPPAAPSASAAPRADLRHHGDALLVDGALDFAVNVEQSPRPAWLERELRSALRASASYPDEREAVAALAARHGRAPAEVVVTNGASEAFWLLAAALDPRNAVCVHPTFSEPEAALVALGRRVGHCFRSGEDFALDPGRVPPGADLVVTSNPNNPTGVLDPAATVAGLLAPGRWLIVDEAFMDFVPGEGESLASRADLPGLVVVRSATKLWSLAGVRAGYILAPAPLAERLRALRPGWNVNALALRALAVCSARRAEAERRARRIGRARDALRSALDVLPGLRTWSSAANFLLVRSERGRELGEALRRGGVVVRPAASFPGLDERYFRVAVRTPALNARLVSALEAELCG